MFKLSSSNLRNYYYENILAFGDLLHRIHPLAGQGLNLGLRDIAALAEVLVQAARRGQDIGSLTTLQSYQQWRRFDVALLAAATDGINRIFSNNNLLMRGMRNLALGVVNDKPSVRRTMIRQAAGLTGDLPRLMQGRAI